MEEQVENELLQMALVDATVRSYLDNIDRNVWDLETGLAACIVALAHQKEMFKQELIRLHETGIIKTVILKEMI